jgi:MFS transporter, DHA1 family, multidrug resistance protein
MTIESSAAIADSDESRRYPYWRRNLRVLPLASFMGSMGFGLCWPFLPLILRGLGVRENLETWVGHMMVVFYIIGFICAPIWGGIADHYGRRIMVLRAMLGMGVTMSLVPFAPTPLWFAGLFLLVGFFNGMLPAVMALLVANTPPRRVGGALSLAQSGSMFGQTVGPAVGTVLAAFMDQQHYMFWISGGLMLSAGMLVVTFVREIKHVTPGPWRPQWIGSLRELLAVPRMGALYLQYTVFALLWGGNVMVISIYVLQLFAAQPANGGSEAFWVGAAAMGLSISGLVALPLWGRALDRWGAERVMVISAIASIVTHLPLLVLQTPLQLVIARVVFGISACAMLPAITQLLKHYAPVGMDARAISYASSCNYVGAGLAPFVAGLVGPVFGLRVYFALAIAATVAGLVVWLRSARAAKA